MADTALSVIESGVFTHLTNNQGGNKAMKK